MKCHYCERDSDWTCESCGSPICELNHAFTFDDDSRAICKACEEKGARKFWLEATL